MTAKLKPLPWRKLSEDAGHPKTPLACQCCGQDFDVELWIECDEADRETTVAITVCDCCARKHINPHPRLYRVLEHNRPFPGAMNVCIECPHRDGMRCASPLLKANGGPGLPIRAAKPSPIFMCGGKNSGLLMDYGLTPPTCDGRPLREDEVKAPTLRVITPEVAP